VTSFANSRTGSGRTQRGVVSPTVSESIFSIGHSTRSFDQFVALLRAHGICTLVDIRSIPHSRRNPQYDQAALKHAIQEKGLVYEHLPGLGGHRRAAEGSPNTGWLNPAFRGFADYMQTEAFEQGLRELLELSQVEGPLAMMCAEAVPWRCHRSLVADALVVRGTSVLHILGPGQTRAHRLSPMARVEGALLFYPADTIPRDSASPRK
jgi:uncharacterized protein (DUF488 family)